MGILALAAEERVSGVEFTEDALSVALMDGRVITVPLVWYPRLLSAREDERNNWQISGGGYGIHWPDIDEDLSTEGLLRGAPAPRKQTVKKIAWYSVKQSVHHSNSRCNTGNNISPEYLRQGTGGKPLCQECNSLNQAEQ
ncbi:MAG TPA: DUF2442 domain-containing protein [Pyrinomonadaceae bacterium]|jgi:hypothetical protein|nr:DUF2442 domain-containing protein [Pyrinomonadaceae bacterium]